MSPASSEIHDCETRLHPVFPKLQVKRRKGEDAEEAEEEERALSTIANLFQGLSRGGRRDRLAAKFVENEFEKCDRLLELYSRYHNRQRTALVLLLSFPFPQNLQLGWWIVHCQA